MSKILCVAGGGGTISHWEGGSSPPPPEVRQEGRRAVCAVPVPKVGGNATQSAKPNLLQEGMTMARIGKGQNMSQPPTKAKGGKVLTV